MSSISAVVEADVDWLSELHEQQKLDIKKLLQRESDPMRAAEMWVGAKLAFAASPTSPEGDDAASTYAREFVINVRNQVHDLICSPDKYMNEKRELRKHGEASRTAVATMIAASISPYVGELHRIALPIVALVLISIGKVGLQSWCATERARRTDDA